MQKPSVLVIHNRYQQAGGEDTVVEAEIDLLRRAGHRVLRYERDNSEIAAYAAPRRASLLFTTSWSAQSYHAIRELIRRHRPQIAHCHNVLPLVSPSAYYACRAEGVPVVQTLHNYRLLCPAGTLFRQGQRCNGCADHPNRSVWRGCYRNSKPQTATVAAMVGCHRLAGTWTRVVGAYVAPSRFCRDMHARAGLPSQRIFHRPNFLAVDPGRRVERGSYALFVGRLTVEKGVLEMLAAWRELRHVPLRVVGDGPLHQQASKLIDSASLNVKLVGQRSHEETLAEIKGARFLVFPSRWHEPFGLTLLEAAACGVPAIAARVGAVPEIVSDGRTGLLFDAENFEELVHAATWAWEHPGPLDEMGEQARRAYLENFTAEQSYERLMQIYRSILRN